MRQEKEHKGGSRLEHTTRERRPWTGKQKALLAVCIVLAVAVAGAAAWKSLFVRPDISSGGRVTGGLSGLFSGGSSASGEEEIDYGEGVRPVAEGERKSADFYTVLILGRDTGGGGNTDTMLLASYDVTNQKAAVMSIPRDTMVNVPWDVKKINSVYNMNGGGEKGVRAVYKEVAQLVGFQPDFQVVVEWEAVGKIVDAIGGVYFDVPYPMDYHDPYQDLVIEQAPGYRLLTGEDAMQVIRWRGNDNDSPYGYRKNNGGIGDSGRMQVQQDFLKAVLKQMLSLQNLSKINKIAKVFQESVETDMSFQNILWFAQQAFMGGLSAEDVEFLTMPWRGTSAWSRSYQQNLSYVVPVTGELLDVVNNKLSPFAVTFTASDLDIMSVNSDGSVRSSTGYVEDRQAAVAPVKPEKTDPAGTEEPLVDENGDPIVTDPETTDPGTEYDPEDPGAGTDPTADPTGGEGGETGGETPEDPGTEYDPEPPEPTEPTEPVPPEGPEEPEFTFVEPDEAE